jgi:diguanylate cyclase (GGDEF)-like protein
MLDIDHFKAINDRFSHTVGDEVLRKLARSLRQQLRDVDLSARFGGEEFVLLLPDTDAPGARQVAEKVRLAVEEGTWGTVHPELAVTVSVGVAMLAPGDDATDLLARADAMLYRAKQSGRNRVCG